MQRKRVFTECYMVYLKSMPKVVKLLAYHPCTEKYRAMSYGVLWRLMAIIDILCATHTVSHSLHTSLTIKTRLH